jgi:hypothetical protein
MNNYNWNDDESFEVNAKSMFELLFSRMDFFESKLDDTLDCLLDNLDRDKVAVNKAKEFYDNDDVKDMLSSFSSSFESGGASNVLNLVSSLQDLKGKLSTLGENLSAVPEEESEVLEKEEGEVLEKEED